MAGETLGEVIRRLGRSGGLQGDLTQTDAQLLERFARRRDELAFAALLARHGPVVLGLCRRLLHDAPDAEDAFQAVFLVLARKASVLPRKTLLGGWLHGVAWRVAVRLRGRAARRHQRERSGVDLESLPADAAAWSEVRWVVQEEVRRLPESYRSAVILCCLEGKTNEEAARLLRRPVGTVKSRLTRARELLRTRLARRGMALSVGGVGAALAANTAPASAALVDATVRSAASFAAGVASSGAAVALAQGVLRTMFLKKLSFLAAAALAVALFGSVGGLAYRSWATAPGDAPKGAARADKPPAADQPKDSATKDKPKDDADAEKIQGTWVVVSEERDGKAMPAEAIAFLSVSVAAHQLAFIPNGFFGRSPYKLDPAKTPKVIELTPPDGPWKGTTVHCLYKLDGDDLKLCFLIGAGEEPKEFATTPGSSLVLLILKRKPADKPPAADQPKDSATKDKPKDDADAEKIRGTWVAVWVETDGKPAPSETIKNLSLLITADKIAFNPGGENRQSTYKLDPTKTPKMIELTPQEGPTKGKTLRGLYELDGDRLKLCVQNGEGEEPKEFATKSGTGWRLLVLRRKNDQGNDRTMADINKAIHEEMQAANKKAAEKAADFEYPKAKKLEQHDGSLGVSEAGSIYVALYATTEDVSKVVRWYDKKLAGLVAGQPAGATGDPDGLRIAINQDGDRPELGAIANRPMSTRCYLVRAKEYTVSVVISRPPGEALTVISLTYMPE